MSNRVSLPTISRTPISHHSLARSPPQELSSAALNSKVFYLVKLFIFLTIVYY